MNVLIVKRTHQTVAVKCITKKNLAKSQNLLSKEIKILQVGILEVCMYVYLRYLYLSYDEVVDCCISCVNLLLVYLLFVLERW